jgi:hypothetical protein
LGTAGTGINTVGDNDINNNNFVKQSPKEQRMKKKHGVIFGCVVLLLAVSNTLAGCAKPSVYVAGRSYDDDGIPKAYYWKDGVKTDLYNGQSNAVGITVSGGAVYVSGSYDDDGIHKACYWKNGVKTDLYNGNSAAVGITVQ